MAQDGTQGRNDDAFALLEGIDDMSCDPVHYGPKKKSFAMKRAWITVSKAKLSQFPHMAEQWHRDFSAFGTIGKGGA